MGGADDFAEDAAQISELRECMMSRLWLKIKDNPIPKLIYYKLWFISSTRGPCEITASELVESIGGITNQDVSHYMKKLSYAGGFRFIRRGRGKDSIIRIYKPGAFNKSIMEKLREGNKK